MSWIYRYETKGIQQWILNSNLLRDLAGGSALVENLTKSAEDEANAAGASDIIQSTSGAMTAVFPSKQSLEKFASEWPMRVAALAPGLQLIQAWVEAEAKLPALFEKLNTRKNQLSVLTIESNPWVFRAARSGLPAVPIPKGSLSVARNTALDAEGFAKEKARGEFLSKSSPVTGGRIWKDFESEVDDWGEGPIAVLHADGSGIGKALMKIGDDAGKLKRFSTAMKEACDAAIREAVNSLGSDKPLCARPIVSAGDDLTYVLRASQARRFGEAWIRAFEAETERRKAQLGAKLYGGVGFVVVNRGYPFSAAYELAEALCKSAKDEIKRREGARAQASVLAFARVTNSLVSDVTDGASGWIVDSSKPNQIDELLRTALELPRGTLRTWLDYFHRKDGNEQALRLWERAREVAGDTKWEPFARALEAVGADPHTGAFRDRSGNGFPLHKSARSTPLSDILTLRFIEKQEEVVSK